ncbi:MAG: PKD domain-containing protein [Thermoplasmata archaeon]|nr:PKD domain-containing protein [Thermoplasmata archaeon]
MIIVFLSPPGGPTPTVGSATPGGNGSTATSCETGLVVISVPTQGPAPLLVQFSAIVNSPAHTGFSWSFGDGAMVVGTNGSEHSLVHLYQSAGNYLANVTAAGPNGTLSCSIGIVVTRGGLEAHIFESPHSGTVPFTAHFVGSASNGTDTYHEFLWDFGDGGQGSGVSLNYTFRTSGNYTVSLRVDDSSGASAIATVRILALPNPSRSPSLGDPNAGGLGGLNGPLLWEGVTVSAAVIVGVGLFALALARRGAARSLAPGLERVGPSADARNRVETAPLAPTPPIEIPGAAETVEVTAPPARTAGSVPPRAAVGGGTGVSVESVRLSQRIIRHLGRSGILAQEGTVGREFTQRGMAEALGVRQGPLSNVLRRLVAAGVVTEELRHVRGAPRRVKAYRLSAEGRALALEIRAGESERLGRTLQPSEPTRIPR